MELFKIKAYGPMEGTAELYVKTQKGIYDSSSGSLECGTVISLDTYYNIFSSGKYLKWTTISSASAELNIKGRFKHELLSRKKGEDDKLLWTAEKVGPIKIPLDLSEKSSDKSLYLRLTALEDGCFFYGGSYTTDEKANPVKVAIIICTYNREEYILRNISEICSSLLDNNDSAVKDSLEVFIIDNGRSLSKLSDHPLVRVYPNKNCGGSGGFTRGLIEVLKRKDEFSHVLFMDDDVVVDPAVIEKTAQFLRFLRPEYADLHIAGGMLLIENPTIQHEATARWNGNVHPLNANLDLVNNIALLENETEKKADYAAWWYLCFPLSVVSESNLPLPFFIKGDDVEYGLRNMKHVLVMNGIGVWHKGFIGKERPYLDYYIIRNYLVISSIYIKKSSKIVSLCVLFKRMMRAVIFDAPEIIEYIVLAVQDYLKGPDVFINIDSEELNIELTRKEQRNIINAECSKKVKIRLLLKKIPTVLFWKAILKYFDLLFLYLKKGKKMHSLYSVKWGSISSVDFWENLIFEK